MYGRQYGGLASLMRNPSFQRFLQQRQQPQQQQRTRYAPPPRAAVGMPPRGNTGTQQAGLRIPKPQVRPPIQAGGPGGPAPGRGPFIPSGGGGGPQFGALDRYTRPPQRLQAGQPGGGLQRAIARQGASSAGMGTRRPFRRSNFISR